MSKKAPTSPHASHLNRSQIAFPSVPRILTAAVTACWLCSVASSAHADLPAGATVVHGSASIATAGNAMTVTNSPGTIVNWQTFSIGQPNAVHFQQQTAASQILNRVTGNNPSQILGTLSSNGKVWLINPSGILFGANARIDVAGLVASTLNATDADFLASRFNFAGAGAGSLVNQGRITTPFGGNVYLIGASARNEGLIQAPGGEIVLAAGQSVELVDSGMPNLIVRINAPASEAVNVGSLIADGGRIDVHAATVNQNGIVRADSVQTDSAGRIVLTAIQSVTLGESSETRATGGTVKLEAETVNNRGEVSGQDISISANDILQQGLVTAPGGHITMTAGRSTYLDGTVDVSNPLGIAGSIWLTTGKLEGMAGGSLRADGLDGGQIHVEGRGMLAFSSIFSATGATQGGSIEITGNSVYLLNADIDASGGTQGGTIHLGGGWQGSGSLPHAREVFIGVGSEVRANGPLGETAVAGRGGELVVWSTESSENYGSLSTRNGGRIEFSSNGSIRPGDLQAGPGGSVLFDPKNIIITDNPPDSIALARKVVSGSVDGEQPALTDGDGFGSSIALDGDRLAVGNDGTVCCEYEGAVYLFTGVGSDFSGLTWQKTLASGTGANGMPALTDDRGFGYSVALDRDRLAVGLQTQNTGGGAVYLFNGVGADFAGLTLRKTLASGTGATGMPALADNSYFASSISIDGDRLAVGAIFDDLGHTGSGQGSGTVHLFTGVGADFSGLTWQKMLASSTGASGMPALPNSGSIGYAIALDGDRMAVGAPFDGPGGTGSGAVLLFTGVGGDFSGLTWQKTLASGTGATGMPAMVDANFFGWSVALDGDRMAVGAPINGTGGPSRGAVYLFGGVGNDFSGLAWQKILSSGSGAAGMLALSNDDWFGLSVALDSDRLAVGAPANRPGSTGDGAVYLFTGLSTLGSGVIGANGATFASNPGGTSYITPATITTLLDAGTAVTLQANNDITLVSPVSTTGNLSSLTLRAGRNIGIFAGINMGNGDLTAVAGDPGADQAFRDPGTPTLTLGDGNMTLYIGGVGTLAAVDGTFVSNGAGLGKTAGLGRWLIYASDPTTSSKYLDNKHYDQSFSLGTVPAYAATGDWQFYSVAPVLSVTPSSQSSTYGDAPTFSPSFAGFIDGDTANSAGISGGATWDSGARSTSGNLTAGSHDVSYAGGLTNSLGYLIADNTASTQELTVSPKQISVSGIVAANKTYDGTVNAAVAGGNLSGVIEGDNISLSGGTGQFDDKNVGTAKTVVLALGLAGTDATNYSLCSETCPILSTTADITPKSLIYRATPATKLFGAPVPALSGSVTGFQGNDTDVTATSGSLVWATPATSNSNPGSYSIAGQGLSARNYEFVQASENDTALTVLAPVVQSDPCRGSVCTVKEITPLLQDAPQVPNITSLGRIIDATEAPAAGLLSSAASRAFAPIDLSKMSRESIVALLADRRELKKKIFADAIFKLKEDPSLAEVKPCTCLTDVASDTCLTDIASGTCMMTSGQRAQLATREVQITQGQPRKQSSVTLPQIHRKLAVLIGINDYQDRRIPVLENAIPDVEVVAKLFEEKLGYETRVMLNPSKADMIKTLNQLSAEINPKDSVVIYYAGHGYLIEDTGVGYWLPSDAPADDPTKWISNSDVSKFLTNIHSNQLVMISDSCYSGTFTREQKLAPSAKTVKPDEILTHRSVVVMSSGGDEPVADEGKEGHSIFAWNLMLALKNVASWQPGSTIFEQVRATVSKEFPQTPQYGAAVSAGHQAGGDYLFEHRQLEPAAPEK